MWLLFLPIHSGPGADSAPGRPACPIHKVHFSRRPFFLRLSTTTSTRKRFLDSVQGLGEVIDLELCAYKTDQEKKIFLKAKVLLLFVSGENCLRDRGLGQEGSVPERPPDLGGRCQRFPQPLCSRAPRRDVPAAADVPSGPGVCHRCVLLTRGAAGMEGNEGGRETLTSPRAGRERLQRTHSGLLSSYPTFPSTPPRTLLALAPGVFPRPGNQRPPPTPIPAGGQDGGDLPGTRSARLGPAAPGGGGAAPEAPARGRGPRGGDGKGPISGRGCGRAAIGRPRGLQPPRPRLVL